MSEKDNTTNNRYVLRRYNQHKYGVYDTETNEYLKKGSLDDIKLEVEKMNNNKTEKTEDMIDDAKQYGKERGLYTESTEVVPPQEIIDAVNKVRKENLESGLLELNDFILQCFDQYRDDNNISALTRTVKDQIRAYAKDVYENINTASLEEAKEQPKSNKQPTLDDAIKMIDEAFVMTEPLWTEEGKEITINKGDMMQVVNLLGSSLDVLREINSKGVYVLNGK